MTLKGVLPLEGYGLPTMLFEGTSLDSGSERAHGRVVSPAICVLRLTHAAARTWRSFELMDIMRKHILGVWLGATENARLCKGLDSLW